jgi:putative aldouronate transport system substrate-binding protein
MPDIITIDGVDPLVKDAAKFALALDTLAEQYDPYFIQTAAKKQVLSFFTESDGHIYGYPNFSTTTQDYDAGLVYGNQGFLVREDIYNALGKPDMTTPAGFLTAMRAAADLGAVDGQGSAVIPFGMPDFGGADSTGIFTNTLLDYIGVPVLDGEGNFYDRYTDPEFIAWTKTIAEANRTGLTSPDLISMQGSDKDSLLSNGSYFAYMTCDLNSETDALTLYNNENSDKPYIAVEGPASLSGRKRALAASGIQGWTRTFISKTCKNPRKAMEFITYLVSEEGDTVMNYGREGQTYELVNGVPVLNADLLEFKQTDPGAFESEIGLTTHLWLQDSARLSKIMGVDQFPKALQQPKVWTQAHLLARMELTGIESCLSREAARNRERINGKWEQTVASILSAKDDASIDKVFDDFKSYRDSTGFPQILEEYNALIKSNSEKLK